MPSSKPALPFLSNAWFSVPMGLCGLALAWHRAEAVMGEAAGAVADALGLLAAASVIALLGAAFLRVSRHPQAWHEDTGHPVRHAFVAAIPISVLLVATVGVARLGPQPWLEILWGGASLVLLGTTVWTLSRWWRGQGVGGLSWASVTPALFIPIVGNVLVPLAGVPLGHAPWSAAQFGIGLLFWPLVLTLLAVRLVLQGLWPDRLLPASFILVAPPAVVGLSSLQLGASPAVAWMCWGMGGLCLLWAAQLGPRIAKLPFTIAHWGLSFPLAAFAGLTLALAGPSGLAVSLAMIVLALASVVITWLTLATIRGLRRGELLVPETVATLQPASSH